jgi:hypothetical protein
VSDKAAYILHGWNQREKKRGFEVPISFSRRNLQWPLPLGPISSTFHHLPIILQYGDQAFNTWVFGRHSGSKPALAKIWLELLFDSLFILNHVNFF